MGKKHPWEQCSPRRGQMTGTGRSPATLRIAWAMAWARNATGKKKGFKPLEAQGSIQLLHRAAPQHAQQKPLAKTCSLFRSVGSRSHCNLSPSVHSLLINWLLTAVVSQIQLNRKSTGLMPHLTACSFGKLFRKAKLPSWTEIFAAGFPWKSCRELGIKSCHFSTAYKRNSDICVTFLSFTTEDLQGIPLTAYLWSSCREKSNSLFLSQHKKTPSD